MSSSSSDNSHQQLTISVLNRVFDFAAVDAKDAILRLGLVSQQWNDCLNYCPSMWERLTEDGWPGSTSTAVSLASSSSATAKNYSYHTFKMKMKTKIPMNQGAKEFGVIQGCANDAEQFQFLCPVLAQNLHILQNEVHPQNGLPIMFCDICEKKVHPVTNTTEIEEAASHGRCVSIEQGPASAWRHTESLSATETNQRGSDVVLNVAVVVSKPKLGDKSSAATTAYSPADFGANILRVLNNYWSLGDRSFPASWSEEQKRKFNADIKENSSEKVILDMAKAGTVPASLVKDVAGKKKGETRRATIEQLNEAVRPLAKNLWHRAPHNMCSTSTRFLSKNALNIALISPDSKRAQKVDNDDGKNNNKRKVSSPGFNIQKRDIFIRYRLVEIDPAPRTEAEIAKCRKEDHPCMGSNPLSNKQMPSNGGWSSVLCADSDASRWFLNEKLWKLIDDGSSISSLAKTGKLAAVVDEETLPSFADVVAAAATAAANDDDSDTDTDDDDERRQPHQQPYPPFNKFDHIPSQPFQCCTEEAVLRHLSITVGTVKNLSEKPIRLRGLPRRR